MNACRHILVHGSTPGIPLLLPACPAAPTCLVRRARLSGPTSVQHVLRATRAGAEDDLQLLRKMKQQRQPGEFVDPVYAAAADYLRASGFTNAAELARVLDVAMNPNSLFATFSDPKRSKNVNARPLDVEKDLKPVIDFLISQDISVSDIIKIISGHPPVLSYSVEGRLRPFWEYMASIGVKDVGAAVVIRPSLLGLDVDNSLRKIVEYLTYVETPTEKIIEYLTRSI